jgi:hypothetical protein
MAGSKRQFLYVTDDGTTQFNIVADESITESVNSSLTAAQLSSLEGIVVLPCATRCRSVTYRSDDGLYTRKAIVLRNSVLTSLPTTITVRSGSGEGSDSGASITLKLKRPRTEQFSRGVGSADSGVTDGDNPN